MIMRRVRNAALVCGMGAVKTWIVSTTGILKMMRMKKMIKGSEKDDNKKCKRSSVLFAGADIIGGIVEIISAIYGWAAAYFDELP